MLTRLIVVIVLVTGGAFKLHRFECFQSESRKFLGRALGPAAGTALVISQPGLNAVRAKHIVAARTVLGVPNDAKTDLAAVYVVVAAVYDCITFKLNLDCAHMWELIS